MRNNIRSFHLFFPAILIAFMTMTLSNDCRAQNQDDMNPPTIIWINSFYGPNNAGIGLGVRHGILGIGATTFAFPGDTTSGIIRPGAIGISVDMYVAADFSKWIAAYMNIGLVGRLGTYQVSPEVLKRYEKHSIMSVGGGFQISLASHLVLGIGYNALVDLPEEEGGMTYNTIQSVVAQLGYRL